MCWTKLSFDRYNEKADQIVRVVFKGNMNGGKINESHVMPPTGPTIKADYPEVIDATRVRQAGWPKVLIGAKQFTGDRMAFVDPNFFTVFTLPFIKGNVKTALTEPNTIVITQETALKYFGKQDAIGKILKFKDSDIAYKVTGVMEPVPVNSHFRYELFVSMAGLEEAKNTSWMQSEFFTYLLLQKGYDYKKLEAKTTANH